MNVQLCRLIVNSSNAGGAAGRRAHERQVHPQPAAADRLQRAAEGYRGAAEEAAGGDAAQAERHQRRHAPDQERAGRHGLRRGPRTAFTDAQSAGGHGAHVPGRHHHPGCVLQ